MMDSRLSAGRAVLAQEAYDLLRLASVLDASFCDALDLIHACRGSVIVTGIGKSGLVGQKIAATLASTGTRAHFLHPAEAMHGDLGRIHCDDLVLALSFSGETEEVLRLLPYISTQLIATTGHPTSSLASAADVVLDLGPLREACPMGLAPTTSTTAMMALGDALAIVLSQMRQFGPEDFARVHPGGSLGARLRVFRP